MNFSRQTAWIVLGVALAAGAYCVLGYVMAASCLAADCAPAPRVRGVASFYLVVAAYCLVAIGAAAVALRRNRGRV